MNKYLKWLYQHSPPFLQNVEFSLARTNLYWERHLSPYYKSYLGSLMKSQWYTKEELERLQNKRLQSTIKHAYDFVPYYHNVFRSLNLKPEDIKTKEDLKQLPIIDKEEVRKNWNDLVSRKFHWWQKEKASTGGSTGAALQIIWSKKSILQEHCFAARLKSWAGVKSTDKCAHFGSATMLIPDNQKKLPFWRFCIPERQIYFSPYHLSEKNLPAYIKKLQRFSPQCIDGHPSKIYIIARYMEKEGLNGINPKAIFSSSEMLLPYQRKKIEEVFDCKVFDTYGNTEHISKISQCENGNNHIISEYGIIEFVRDEEEVAPGEVGEMVCTGFTNYAMPLIRYRMEDLAVPTDERCGCNRGLPLVKSIQGRTRDIIVTKDGRYLTTGAIIEGVGDIKSIKEWQVIQKSKEYYIINITVDQRYYSEGDLSRLRGMIRKRVGEGKIEINIVDKIIKPENKFRAVISEVKI